MQKLQEKFNLKQKELRSAILLLSLLAIASFIYGGYQLYILSEENTILKENITTLENTISDTENALLTSETEKTLLAEALRNEQERLGSIQGIIDEVTDTVSDLEKLNELDSELLQKYSKVYFLNEHYTPDGLVEIDDGEYLYYEDEPEKIHKKVWSFLRKLLKDAQDDDIPLFIASGYRSFGTQTVLKSGYVVTYGSGTANQFSAEQGFSEHQLGTTVDFMTTGINGTFSGFENTESYEWLLKNAYKYGLILSYPEGNTYYQFEPWHWRFVGKDLAKDLRDDKINFYDMPQRAIDDYLLEIFD